MRRGGIAFGRIQFQRILELGFCLDGLALSEQDRAEHTVADDPARFALRAFGQRQEQLRKGKGFLNLTVAIRVSELAEGKWQNERRRLALLAKFKSPPATVRH